MAATTGVTERRGARGARARRVGALRALGDAATRAESTAGEVIDADMACVGVEWTREWPDDDEIRRGAMGLKTEIRRSRMDSQFGSQFTVRFQVLTSLAGRKVIGR